MSSAVVIGLTGNIATGKSTVGHMLQALGAQMIDADQLAHQALAVGTEAHAQVAALFGRWVLNATGEIDRARLGRLVFADPQALEELERIVHPPVIAATRRLVAEAHTPIVCLEAIKLLESELRGLCQAIWVVTASRETQTARLVATRGLTIEQAALRIDAQPPQAAKVAQADVVLDNDGALENTWTQVVRAWNQMPTAPRWPDDCLLPCEFHGAIRPCPRK